MSNERAPYVSDEQIRKDHAKKAFDHYLNNIDRINGHGDFGLGAISGAEVVRDLYEAHLKEKDELLREAAEALEEVLGGSRQSLCDHLSHPLAGDRHRMGEPCPPAARLEALLSRINEHLNR